MLDVLQILEQDPRVTPDRIATMSGRPVEEVEAIIRRAEAERIILRYKTQINWEKAGVEQVQALIEVKVVPQREVGFDTVAARIARFPETRSVHLVSGTFDLAVVVTGKTMKDIASFVSERLATLEWVQGTTTHFLLKTYKEDGEVLAFKPKGGEKLR